MIKLYVLFNKTETDKKVSEDNRTPIPYDVLGFTGKEYKDLSFAQRNEKLKSVFSNKQSMNMIYDFYKNLTSLYTEEYTWVKEEEYNKMIKHEIDDILLDRLLMLMARYGVEDVVKNFLNK